jgi:hypothetical protein
MVTNPNVRQSLANFLSHDVGQGVDPVSLKLARDLEKARPPVASDHLIQILEE